MTIYIDDTFTHPTKGPWCHMWTDGPREELDAFAARLGLRRAWADVGGSMRLYHYDLRPEKRALALEYGAEYMPMAEWIRRYNERNK